MVEQSIRNRQVVGSTPTFGSIDLNYFPALDFFSVCNSNNNSECAVTA